MTYEPTYKVFEVDTEKGKEFQIFWCPSAPIHYADRIVYSPKTYPQRQGAYRKCKQLNNDLAEEKATETVA